MTHRIAPGALVLTQHEVRLLYQAARLGELRSKHRVGNSALYALLTDITICAFSAEPGNEPRQIAEKADRGFWTVKQLARATGRAERTIRHDIALGSLPAEKAGNSWTITRDEATAYAARWK